MRVDFYRSGRYYPARRLTDKEITRMLFDQPPIDERESAVIDKVEDLRKRLRLQLFEPRRWFGSLRRLSFARAIQGSNSIEGFNAALDDVAAAAAGEEPLDADTETKLALWGYREAMTYVLQLAGEFDFEYSEQLLKSLHFMMTNYDLSKRPGLWRAGTIYVRNEDTGEIAYEGPDVDLVPSLVGELVERLNEPDSTPAMVRAGMAHLNLAMVHPFRDGNGRMARCLQTLILAREGMLAPQFCSIEEYLGRNTEAYYAVLAEAGGGSWQPERDTRSWMRFILTAHFRQAQTLLRRVRESEQLWSELEKLVAKHALPERVIPALFDAALGLRVRNATYRTIDEGMSEQTASRDLRSMVDRGLLEPHGEKRGRHYVATDELADVWGLIRAKRSPRPNEDPFADN
jgi:Fic family protein